MAKHRLFEPGTERLAELTRWFRVERLGGHAAFKRAQALGWPGSLALYKIEHGRIMGDESHNADIQARAVAEGRLPPGGPCPPPAGVDAALVPPTEHPLPRAVAPGPIAPPELQALDPDPLVNIQRLLERQLQHGLASLDPSVMEKALRTVSRSMITIAELRRAQGSKDEPRVFIYLPEERPDPHACDPNDPASWPNARAA